MIKRLRVPRPVHLDQVRYVYDLTLKWEKSRNAFDLRKLIEEKEKLSYEQLVEFVLAYASRSEPMYFGGKGKLKG